MLLALSGPQLPPLYNGWSRGGTGRNPSSLPKGPWGQPHSYTLFQTWGSLSIPKMPHAPVAGLPLGDRAPRQGATEAHLSLKVSLLGRWCTSLEVGLWSHIYPRVLRSPMGPQAMPAQDNTAQLPEFLSA